MCDSSNNYLNYLLPASTNCNTISSSTGVFPSVTDFAGELNFEIILNTNETVKKKWLVNMKQPVDFGIQFWIVAVICDVLSNSNFILFIVFRKTEKSIH